MKKLLLAFAFCSFLSFSQEKINLTRDGVGDIITEVSNLTAVDLYSKSKEWVQLSYKNPSEVLKADIENKTIRLEGFCSDCYYTKSLGIKYYNDVLYTMILSFKDGKYKTSITIDRMLNQGRQVQYSYRNFFKKDGTIRKVYKVSYDSLLESLNATYLSLFNHITGATNKSDDW